MEVSIIIPTLNEEKNIDTLLEEITYFMEDEDYEVIFVDDYSKDRTAEKVLEWNKKFPNIKLLRKPSRKKDLSKSVIYGIKNSTGEEILVMDADLAHPPEKIPEILSYVDNYEIVIGTRKKVENWLRSRKDLSRLGKFLVKPLVKVRDPLSGFFAFKKKILNGVKLNPLGYKILIEILVKTNSKRVKEVDFTFKDRKFGDSKLNNRIMIQYLIHVIKLYFHVFFKR